MLANLHLYAGSGGLYGFGVCVTVWRQYSLGSSKEGFLCSFYTLALAFQHLMPRL